MAQPFIVPGVAQFTIHGSSVGRNVANVIHYKLDTTGTISNRGDACNNLAGTILTSWNTNILSFLASTYIAQSVSWLDLNSESGAVGSRSTSGAVTWPQAGGQLTASQPNNVAYLIRKNTAAVRGAKRGRMYLCGVTEVVTDTAAINSPTAGNITNINTKMATFKTDTEKSDTVLWGFGSAMVVPHILTRYPPKAGQDVGSPATGEGHTVNSLTCDGTLATQRRRLR